MGAEIVFGVISAIGTVVSTVGSMQQASAQQEQHEYQAAISRNNAIIAQQDRQAMLERAALDEADHRRRIHQTVGAARAAAAGNGFMIDADTNALLTTDIVRAGELDILRLRDDIALRSRQLDLEAQGHTNQSRLHQAGARATNPLAAGFGTLLEGASRSAGIFLNPSGSMFSSSTVRTPGRLRAPLGARG